MSGIPGTKGPWWAGILGGGIGLGLLVELLVGVPPGGSAEPTIIGKDGVEMVFIPAGSFQMGYEEGEDNERPVHTVYLDAFYIDKYEVTNARFAQFVQATGYQTVLERKGEGYVWDEGWKWVKGVDWRHPEGPQSNLEGRMEHPVVHIAWEDAVAYAQYYGKRLPTEAEWEKAARGPLCSWYDHGDELDHDKANVDTNGTRPVGSYPPQGYGLCDMTGNVWEWCYDWFAPDYYQHSPAANPTGPDSGQWHVCRGGSWASSAEGARATLRNYHEPRAGNFSIVGFRCVLSASAVGS